MNKKYKSRDFPKELFRLLQNENKIVHIRDLEGYSMSSENKKKEEEYIFGDAFTTFKFNGEKLKSDRFFGRFNLSNR